MKVQSLGLSLDHEAEFLCQVLGLDIWTVRVRGFGLDHKAHVFVLGNEDQVIGLGF